MTKWNNSKSLGSIAWVAHLRKYVSYFFGRSEVWTSTLLFQDQCSKYEILLWLWRGCAIRRTWAQTIQWTCVSLVSKVTSKCAKGQMLLRKIFAPIVGETEPLKLLHLCILSNKWITITQCDSDSYLFLTWFGPPDEIVDLIN